MNDFEEIKEWVQELKSEKIPIIVEGESDKVSLENLGIKRVKALSRKPISEFIENIKESELILLMDMDKKGKELTNEMGQICQRLKIKINLKYWKLLPKLKVSQVEGIYRCFKRLEARVV